MSSWSSNNGDVAAEYAGDLCPPLSAIVTAQRQHGSTQPLRRRMALLLPTAPAAAARAGRATRASSQPIAPAAVTTYSRITGGSSAVGNERNGGSEIILLRAGLACPAGVAALFVRPSHDRTVPTTFSPQSPSSSASFGHPQ